MTQAVLTGNWNYPTKMLVGPGRIAELPAVCKNFGVNKPLLVTDKGLAENPMITKALASLREAGLDAGLYSDVVGNPHGSHVEAGVEVFRRGGYDGVVAFGGGSALDVGKLIAFMAGQTRPLWDYEDVADWWTRADPNGIRTIIAVPTTSGTGSEVGRASVVTNDETHDKKIIFHPKMLPSVVIADPELTVGLPPKVTAATGIDAFVHCFEAYCAPGFHPMADGIALEGMRLVKDFLPRAYTNGGDIEARSRMLAAASMGATAFQKGLGAVHSIAHPLGALFDIHHGLANAILLPYVMVYNKPAIAERMKLLASVLGLEGDGFEAVLDWVLSFREQLGIPHTLAAVGIDASRAAEIGVFAQNDPSTGSNPRSTTPEDMANIFRAAVVGDLTLGQ
jgi:alcohol dehydrogenase class IV